MDARRERESDRGHWLDLGDTLSIARHARNGNFRRESTRLLSAGLTPRCGENVGSARGPLRAV